MIIGLIIALLVALGCFYASYYVGSHPSSPGAALVEGMMSLLLFGLGCMFVLVSILLLLAMALA